MCQLKSAIVLKDRIYLPEHNNHSKMLEELGIKDESNTPDFVRVEFSPSDGDAFSDVDTWKLKVDQDFRPDWFFEEVELPKIHAAVKEWAQKHIFVGVDDLKLSSGSGFYLKDCRNVELSGTVFVDVMSGSSSVDRMCDSASVDRMFNSSSMGEMCDSARVDVMSDSSSVGEMSGSSRVDRMSDSASVDRMYGSSSVGAMFNSSSVGEMFDSSSVGEMCGSARVDRMYDSASMGEMFNSSSIFISKDCGTDVSTICLQNDAMIQDARTKTILTRGTWKLVSVNG